MSVRAVAGRVVEAWAGVVEELATEEETAATAGADWVVVCSVRGVR